MGPYGTHCSGGGGSLLGNVTSLPNWEVSYHKPGRDWVLIQRVMWQGQAGAKCRDPRRGAGLSERKQTDRFLLSRLGLSCDFCSARFTFTGGGCPGWFLRPQCFEINCLCMCTKSYCHWLLFLFFFIHPSHLYRYSYCSTYNILIPCSLCRDLLFVPWRAFLELCDGNSELKDTKSDSGWEDWKNVNFPQIQNGDLVLAVSLNSFVKVKHLQVVHL